MSQIPKSAIATLYMHTTRAHCIGKLTNYFAFPNVKAVLNDLYGMESKVLSDVELDVIDDGRKRI